MPRRRMSLLSDYVSASPKNDNLSMIGVTAAEFKYAEGAEDDIVQPLPHMRVLVTGWQRGK